ncbi:MAG: hypothetical protein ACI91B_003504, partial [Planctomycetota bacterium]
MGAAWERLLATTVAAAIAPKHPINSDVTRRERRSARRYQRA